MTTWCPSYDILRFRIYMFVMFVLQVFGSKMWWLILERNGDLKVTSLLFLSQQIVSHPILQFPTPTKPKTPNPILNIPLFQLDTTWYASNWNPHSKLPTFLIWVAKSAFPYPRNNSLKCHNYRTLASPNWILIWYSQTNPPKTKSKKRRFHKQSSSSTSRNSS